MRLKLSFILLLYSSLGLTQKLPEIEITPEWVDIISRRIPAFQNTETKNILVLSLATGYKHWIIPHNEVLIREISKKANYHLTISQDISFLEDDSLKLFDAVVLNNTCPEKPYRNLIYDVQIQESDSATSWSEAKRQEDNLIKYVYRGGGLVLLHGGLLAFNQSEKFSNLAGASFDYHPPQQAYVVEVSDVNHPITAEFNNEFTIYGEPYFLNGAYSQLGFDPLLAMRTKGLKNLKHEPTEDTQYISWIKKHGEGRIFVTAPAHNAQAFEIPGFIPFIANGLQYAVGNLILEEKPAITTEPSWKKKQLLFDDSGTTDWRRKWFLDGSHATITHDENGMHFQAGKEWGNDTSHAVLWTKKSFKGNILIEYDYTRTDSETRGVNILYFHTTGKGDNEYPKDIRKWNDEREIPTMSTYFRNMNAYHISYATSSNNLDTTDYVRLRRYEAQYRLSGTEILPDNFNTGLFKKDVTYHIEISRFENEIKMKVTNPAEPSNNQTFSWDASGKPSCDQGWIGLRHMYTRSAIYKNFKVWNIQKPTIK
ncbi:MAG: type 1 glutamine amidotransferase [Cyclobacteriaceae bacterium]|jgi:type 1 glutamine amidotransferase